MLAARQGVGRSEAVLAVRRGGECYSRHVPGREHLLVAVHCTDVALGGDCYGCAVLAPPVGLVMLTGIKRLRCAAKYALALMPAQITALDPPYQATPLNSSTLPLTAFNTVDGTVRNLCMFAHAARQQHAYWRM